MLQLSANSSGPCIWMLARPITCLADRLEDIGFWASEFGAFKAWRLLGLFGFAAIGLRHWLRGDVLAQALEVQRGSEEKGLRSGRHLLHAEAPKWLRWQISSHLT